MSTETQQSLSVVLSSQERVCLYACHPLQPRPIYTELPPRISTVGRLPKSVTADDRAAPPTIHSRVHQTKVLRARHHYCSIPPIGTLFNSLFIAGVADTRVTISHISSQLSAFLDDDSEPWLVVCPRGDILDFSYRQHGRGIQHLECSPT